MGNLDGLKQQLQSRCQKVTRHRLAILSILEASKTPLSAEDIYRQLNNSSFRINLSTIYRNLERMLADKLIVKQGTINHRLQYSFRRDTHSHHVICLKCNKMIPIEECPLDFFARQLIKDEGFFLTDHHIELYGYCRECRVLNKEDENE